MSDQDVVYAKGCTDINQLNQLTSPSNRSNDKMAFFYNPPGDHQIYHITCELSSGNINKTDLISDHKFYYKLDDKNFYQMSCILISNSLIVQFLNKNIYGIELKQGEEQQQEYLTFSNGQRNNLEFHLREFLFNHLSSKQINKESVSTYSEVDNKIIAQPKL